MIYIGIRLTFFIILAFGSFCFIGCQASHQPTKPTDTNIPVYSYQIINEYLHDATSFTQGLYYDNGYFYESSGLYGQSELRKIDPITGNITEVRRLSEEYFGEGITALGDEIYQLTWKSHIGFVYNNFDFSLNSTFTYATEGWGLTTDGLNLIMSDGTNKIFYIDPDTFKVVKVLDVVDGERPIVNINELEYINGEIFANIWHVDYIACISPETGQVVRWIDMRDLMDHQVDWSEENVLNGIAYDKDNKRLFVTGKRWPYIYEVELEMRAGTD